MKNAWLLLLVLCCTLASALAQQAPGSETMPPETAPAARVERTAEKVEEKSTQASKAAEEAKRHATEAAAALEMAKKNEPHGPDFLEGAVDTVLERFDVHTSGNTTTHFIIAGLFILVAFALRRAVTFFIFGIFRKAASRTKTTLDDKLFTALEGPVALLIVVIGAVAALKVLKLPSWGDRAVAYGYTLAFSFVVFWLLLRAFNTLLDHMHEVARHRHMGVAAFMPWIKKALLTIFVIFGVLMVAQSLGADVKAFLAGLGIGGLAVALAAQDTIANVFGSVVIAIDHPFKIGEFVQVGGNSGAVEDIGLRSTRLRRADKALVIIPNKTVAAEPIINLSRFTMRRVEQTIGLTYDSKPEQIAGLVDEIREMILASPEIDKPSVIVQFTNFSASSLDVWIVYQTLDPDFVKHLKLKERFNMEIMRAVQRRGLAFAFPTQTVLLEGENARKMAERSVDSVVPSEPKPKA
jgi:MscS family membrane protein